MRQLFLHGIPRLTREESGAADCVLSPREAALLAWLHLEGPTPRARIAGLLWPASSEAQARANLRQTLARLKRTAGAVVAENDGLLRLAVPVAADAQGGELLATAALDDAPEFADWLAARREGALRQRQRDQLALAAQCLDAGQIDSALAAADAVLTTHPESEEAWRVRMAAFQRRGDRASAVQAWDDCRHALRAAFGVAPSAATQALGRQLLADEAPPVAAAGTPLPPALRHPPRLVGREQALAALLQGAALGHAAAVLGPGGIGKSRLLAELAQRCGPALATGARPGDAQQPGALLARLVATALRRFEPTTDAATAADLARLLPAAPGPAAPADLQSAPERRRLLHAVARALQACSAKGMRLVLVDDLHFADDASLHALEVVVGLWLAQPAGPEQPPPVVFAAREDELPAPAVALLDLLGRSGRAARIELTPLPVDQVQALAAALVEGPPGLADALHAQLGGNPGFLLESLKSLWLDGLGAWQPGSPVPVPPPLREAVRRRLLRLSPPALQVAQLAAIAQGDFSLGLAAATLGCTLLALAPLLRELEQAQVFDGQGFGHDLLAEAVCGGLPTALTSELHAVVADHLVAREGPPGSIAHHLLAAGRRRDALPWTLQAAQQARARWLMTDAAGAYAAAARLLDQPADRESAFAAWRESARCHRWADQHAPAQAAMAAAAPLARSRVEQTLLLAVQTALAFGMRQLGDAVAFGTRLVAALDACFDDIAIDEVAYGLRALGNVVPHGVAVAPCLALADRALARAPLGDAAHLAVQLRCVRGGLLHWALRLQEARADLDAAWDALPPGSDPGLRVLIANQLMRTRHTLGDLAGASSIGQVLLAEAAQLQLGEIFQCDVMHVLAMIEIGQGNPVAGMARFDTLVQRFARTSPQLPDAFLCALALACMAVGRHDDALAWLDRHPARGGDGFVLPDVSFLLTRAKLALRLQDDPTPWLAQLPPLDALPPAIRLQCRVGLATLRPPPPAELAALAQQLAGTGMRCLQRSLAVVAARAALADGLPAQAWGHASRALDLADCVDAWIDDPAAVWLAGAQAAEAAGDPEQACDCVSTGAAWIHERARCWVDERERDAWCRSQPVHRALLALAARGPMGRARLP